MRKHVFQAGLSILCCLLLVSAVFAQTDKLKGSRVLVYTKNGKGYVHDNIASAVDAVKVLGKTHGFLVDVADTSLVFTEANLRKYKMLIFTSTNNDVFATDEERVAFRRYIEAGGGFVGVHSVTGTERNWHWFKMMIGETFSWHAKYQRFTVRKIDPSHPSMKDVPAEWSREDECYFGKELYPGMRVLMAHQLSSLNREDKAQADLIQKNQGQYADYYPAVWWQPFEGGNVWVTTLGHHKDSYKEPVYRNHLLQGIRFMANQFKGLDYAKAQATTKDDPLKK
ncbi:ThuA domain-containing protein [Sediminibacterium soli]|uniref:ThuA domain-containing protein n=1 Tax=Sediminibacterium soli TaxID=2698829 RepID=UPI00137955EC|nr:ThuA domain-containing protein [Sediminibacterium soli]NCI46840.1 ThuA domain-containing protein [Sediminibacterium soli]